MPVVSRAQLGKFAELHKQGKISDAMFHEWTHGVDAEKLPERVKPKPRKRVKPKRKVGRYG